MAGSAISSSRVAVIGGGPAGSTVASLLARRGYDVSVFEKASFPRDHVGESMLPFCYPIFEELGVLPEMERRYVRKPGVRFLDTDDVTETVFCFGSKIQGPSHLSFQVIRAEFDELLLDNARSLGATVEQQTRVLDVDLDSHPGRVRLALRGPQGDSVHEAEFVVDASGRDTLLANRLKTKTAHRDLERSALSAHWKSAKYKGGLEEGLIQIIYTGGEKQGWIWAIPLSVDRVSVGVVMNTAYFRSMRDKLRPTEGDGWQQALYEQELGQAAFVSEILAEATQAWPLRYDGDYSYSVSDKWGPSFALVGDASAFIDPIFSSGVYMAMNSARLVAGAVAARLDGSEDTADQFTDVYGRISRAYDLVDKLIHIFYEPETVNWAQLGDVGSLFEHQEQAISLQHFLLAGDFFEQAGKYDAFLDTLREPRMFQRYRKLIMERPRYRATSCDNGSLAFPATLASYDRERELRGI